MRASGAGATRADGRKRGVVGLATGDRGDLVVEEVDERANDPGLRLTALAEEDDVMAGDDSVFDKGNDGLLEADDSREVLFSLLDARYEVLAHLLLDCLTLPAGFL